MYYFWNSKILGKQNVKIISYPSLKLLNFMHLYDA